MKRIGSDAAFHATGGGGRTRVLPPVLLRRWQEGLSAWGAPPETRAALDRLGDPATIVVVTGQQPGVWGGPLFTLYKAATAVALAERLAAESGRPAVPVFWVQGDDTDWGEVAWGALPRPDLGISRHRFLDASASRRWVGSGTVSAPAEALDLAAAWKRPAGLFDILPAPAPEELSPSFIRALLSLFGSRGILPLDARWPEIREAGAPLWQRYLGLHQDLARAVAVRGHALAAKGLPAPLGEEASDHGLFVLEGERRRELDPAGWEAAVGDLLTRGEANRLAPSVLLRAVLQDLLLCPVAQVVGTAEGAYLHQLAPVYEGLGVPEPARVPRLRALLAPAGLLPAADRDCARLDPEAWLAAATAQVVSAEARARLEGLRRDLGQGFERLGQSVEGARDMAEILASARRKMDYELGRVEESLLRRGRQELYRRDPRLRNAGEFLRPRRGEQERGLSGGTLALLFGERAPEVLMAAARSHVANWTAGEERALILEASDD